MKSSRSSRGVKDQAKNSDDSLDRVDTRADAPLTPEERTRLLAELEAELEAAERSIREEGTITGEEFLKLRADYWVRVSPPIEDQGGGPRRKPR